MYEVKLNYTIVDKKGNDKIKCENLILEHAESFADAEQIGYDYGSGLTGIDVISIKRSKLKEIVNPTCITGMNQLFVKVLQKLKEKSIVLGLVLMLMTLILDSQLTNGNRNE